MANTTLVRFESEKSFCVVRLDQAQLDRLYACLDRDKRWFEYQEEGQPVHFINLRRYVRIIPQNQEGED